MPRLLSQLLKKFPLSKPLKHERFDIGKIRKRKVSLHKPLPPRPSFDPANYERSILFSPDNPIVSSWDHTYHKSLPPYPRNIRRVRRQRYAQPVSDQGRVMTPEERTWWSDPYLHMLSSPLRQDVISSTLLPSDFLLRLGRVEMPSNRLSSPKVALVPEGLEHSRFRPRNPGKGFYVLCWRDAVREFVQSGMWRKIQNGVVHSLLDEQIAHLLRLRVLQELKILATQLRHSSDRFTTPVVRRLRRSEWKELQNTGTLHDEHALAIVVVPPLNKDPILKRQVQPSMSASPPTEAGQAKETPKRPSHPQSELAAIGNTQFTFPDVDTLPSHRIPIYHGPPLFPVRSQRATLYSLLGYLAAAETAARRKARAPAPGPSLEGSNPELKASHAFVICADPDSAQRADIAPLAVALWRLRMYEGQDWQSSSGWVKRLKYRSMPESWE